MRINSLTAALCALLFSLPTNARKETGLAGLLVDVKIECKQLEVWGTSDDGEEFHESDYSCRVPDRLKELPHDKKASFWVAAASYPDQRYAILAAAAALGRLHELTPSQRMRLALELSLREGEPFASARIGFVFGDKPWWESKSGPATLNWQLGSLPMPWAAEQTAEIREYLFPKLPKRPVSTLAVYLAKQLAEAGKLDPAITPDLHEVIRKKADSFEAELASEALKALKTYHFPKREN